MGGSGGTHSCSPKRGEWQAAQEIRGSGQGSDQSVDWRTMIYIISTFYIIIALYTCRKATGELARLFNSAGR